MPEPNVSRLACAKNSMPALVREALLAQGFMDAYEERPPYQQKDSACRIARVTSEARKQKRLIQMLDELRGGKLCINMT